MTETSRSRLTELQGRINGFEAIKCGMRHEAVQRVPDSIEPLPNEAVDHGFLRCEYCPGERRSIHVACAHTLSRNVMQDAIRDLLQLDEELPPGQQQTNELTELQDALVALDIRIFQLDQRRSDIELEHARCAQQICQTQGAGGESADQQQKYDEISAEIARMEAEHDEYVDQAAALCDRLRARLNRTLDG